MGDHVFLKVKPREARELRQRSSYLRLERGRKDERCRQEEGLSACARRHALSKWYRVIEIASEVSRLVMSLDR